MKNILIANILKEKKGIYWVHSVNEKISIVPTSQEYCMYDTDTRASIKPFQYLLLFIRRRKKSSYKTKPKRMLGVTRQEARLNQGKAGVLSVLASQCSSFIHGSCQCRVPTRALGKWESLSMASPHISEPLQPLTLCLNMLSVLLFFAQDTYYFFEPKVWVCNGIS